MNDNDFARAELDFRDAIARYIDACQNYGVDTKSRLDDCVYDALFDAGIEATS